jgi:hypothetical protein
LPCSANSARCAGHPRSCSSATVTTPPEAQLRTELDALARAAGLPAITSDVATQ